MAKAASPPRFTRGHFHDPNFTAEITAKMQVPKRIKVTGIMDDDDDFPPQMPWQPEKVDMRVPDRILVTGKNSKIIVYYYYPRQAYHTKNVSKFRRRWSHRRSSSSSRINCRKYGNAAGSWINSSSSNYFGICFILCYIHFVKQFSLYFRHLQEALRQMNTTFPLRLRIMNQKMKHELKKPSVLARIIIWTIRRIVIYWIKP